ncbi:hypothetical protein [Dethiothermospora halolimnae]|uniref:hypothetical protein n=1 Tax=Dethiothermospora halolimnae TaxID=3114390 RepID=UPI003CCC446A
MYGHKTVNNKLVSNANIKICDNFVDKHSVETYEKAKEKHPERWSKNTRNWTLPEYVALNPIKEKEIKDAINYQKA